MNNLIKNSVVGLLFLVSCLSQGLAQFNQTCTRHLELTPVSNFDTEQFLGKWIAIKLVRQTVEGETPPIPFKCLESHIRRSNGSEDYDLVITETYELLSNGNKVSADSVVTIPDNDTQAIWEILGDGDTQSKSVHLHTDYKTWALQYLCFVQTNNGYRHEEILVYRRSREPDQRLDEFLDILVENYGFPLENSIVVDQSNCTDLSS